MIHWSVGVVVAVAVLGLGCSASGEGKLPAAVPGDTDDDRLPAGASARFGTVRFTHQRSIEHVVYSQDGKTLASAARDGTVRLWDIGTGKQLWCRDVSVPVVDCLAFSPDGKLLAWDAHPGACEIVEARTGKFVCRLEGQGTRIKAIAFSPDSRRLAIGNKDGAVDLWDATSGEAIRALGPHEGGCCTVAFSPNGKLLASGGGSRGVRLWDLSSGKSLRVLDWDHPSPKPSAEDWVVLSVAFSPDGKFLAAGSQQESSDEVVHVWEASSGKKLGGFLGGMGRAKSVSFSPDGSVLAAAGVKRGVMLWIVPSGKPLRKQADGADSVCFSPDGRTLATGGASEVQFWDAETGKELRPRLGHRGEVLGAMYVADGGVIATVSYDRTARLWDTKSRKELLSVREERVSRLSIIPCSSVWVSPDGRRLAYAKRDDAICLRDVPGGKEVREYRTGGTSIDSFAVSPDRKTLAVRTSGLWGGKTTIHLYDFATGERTRSFEDPSDDSLMYFTGGRLAFSPDGAILASADCSSIVHLWEVATGKELRQLRGHESAVLGVAFSPTGRVLASGAGGLTVPMGSTSRSNMFTDTTIRFWDTSTGRQLLSIKHDEGPVYTVAFSRDGNLLAAGDMFGTICLREVATAQEVLRYRNPGSHVCAVAFAPDGATLISGMSDGTILHWNLAPPDYRPADNKALDRLWADLGAAEVAKAYRAVWALTAARERTTAFLQSRLKRTPAEKPERIRELVAALDDDDFDKREAAARELGRLGKQAEEVLRTALAKTTSEEVRKRALPLVKALEGWVITDPDTLRVIRAIWVLERIGTQDAKMILQELARGASELRVTQEAKSAVTFLSGQE